MVVVSPPSSHISLKDLNRVSCGLPEHTSHYHPRYYISDQRVIKVMEQTLPLEPSCSVRVKRSRYAQWTLHKDTLINQIHIDVFPHLLECGETSNNIIAMALSTDTFQLTQIEVLCSFEHWKVAMKPNNFIKSRDLETRLTMELIMFFFSAVRRGP